MNMPRQLKTWRSAVAWFTALVSRRHGCGAPETTEWLDGNDVFLPEIADSPRPLRKAALEVLGIHWGVDFKVWLAEAEERGLVAQVVVYGESHVCVTAEGRLVSGVVNTRVIEVGLPANRGHSHDRCGPSLNSTQHE